MNPVRRAVVLTFVGAFDAHLSQNSSAKSDVPAGPPWVIYTLSVDQIGRKYASNCPEADAGSEGCPRENDRPHQQRRSS